MAIPYYQSLMLPFLKLLADGAEHTLPVVTAALAVEFSLTEAERHEHLPSGNQGIMRNRVGWARTYFKKVSSTSIGPWIYNSKENTTLATARDALLPKLLSGELKVS